MSQSRGARKYDTLAVPTIMVFDNSVEIARYEAIL